MKKKIIFIVLSILFINILLVVLVHENTKKYIMKDGMLLALTVDGEKAFVFPEKENKYHVDLNCENDIVAKYQPVKIVGSDGYETNDYEMKLTVENINTSTIKCDLNFKSISNNSEYLLKNIVKNEATEVIHTNNDKSYRYQGKQPNNWVWFNNEYWRIVGSIPTSISDNSQKEHLVKIVRATSIGTYNYNNDTTEDFWENVRLYRLLNDYYYGKKDNTSGYLCDGKAGHSLCNFKVIGISDSNEDYYGRMIKDVYMNNGIITTNGTVSNTYNTETKRLTGELIQVGLVNASDYGYANGATIDVGAGGVTLANLKYYTKYNWLYTGENIWTMTRINTGAVVIGSDGQGINANTAITQSGSGNAVYPAIYLNSSVYVINGSGTEADPYILGM